MAEEGPELSLTVIRAKKNGLDPCVVLDGEIDQKQQDNVENLVRFMEKKAFPVRSVASSLIDKSNIQRAKRIKYRWSRLWISILFVLQLAILVFGLLSLLMTIKNKRKTWETQAQIASIFWPMSLVFFLVIAIANPLKKSVKLEVTSAVLHTFTFICEYAREIALELMGGRIQTLISPLFKLILFSIVSSILTLLVLKKRERLKGKGKTGISRKSTRKLITNNLPLTFASVMVSILYISSESMGCVLRRKNDDIECWDIITSNYSFSQIFVTFFFMSNYAIPFAKSRITKNLDGEMNIENMYKFKLPPKEQLGLLVFIFAMFTGLLLFASSNEKVELHELDEKSKLYEEYYSDRKAFLDNNTDSNSWIRKMREAFNFFTVITCIFVASTTFMPNHRISEGVQRIKLMKMSSTSLTEAAPVYINFLYFFVFFLFSFVLAYLVLVIKLVEEDDANKEKLIARGEFDEFKRTTEVTAQQLSRYCNYTWPCMAAFILFIFFSKPRNPSASTTALYFILPVYLSLKGFCDSLLGLGFNNAVYHHLAAMFLALFFKIAKRARTFLGMMDDQTLEIHLLNTFVKICAAMPPIMFLLFESISCPLRYNNPTIHGAGFYKKGVKKGCSDQRPSFDETFCQWAEWKSITGALNLTADHYYSWNRPPMGGREEADPSWYMKFDDAKYEEVCNVYITRKENYTYNLKVTKDWNVTKNDYTYFPNALSYVNWNFQSPCPLEMCDGVGIPNLVVILHLTGMLIYWIIFGFMYKDITWDDIATLDPSKIKFHHFFQILAITVATALSFFTFGTRSEDSIALVEDIKFYLLAAVLTLWGACFLVQGLYLRSLHMVTEGNLEDIIDAFADGDDDDEGKHVPRPRVNSGLARFQRAAKKVRSNPVLATNGKMPKFVSKKNRFANISGRSSIATSMRRSSIGGNKQRQHMWDIPTRILIWLDAKCEVLLRKYFSSNDKEQIGVLYRGVAYLLLYTPLTILIYSISRNGKAPGFYWVYDLYKFFGVHAATILLNSTFTEEWKAEIFVLISVPLMEIISATNVRNISEDEEDEKIAVSGTIYGIEKTLTIILFCISSHVCFKCKRCMEGYFGPEEKATHAIDSAFISGFITSTIPLIYVSSEAVGCIWRNFLEGGTSKDITQYTYLHECGGIIWGAKAFMLQASVVFMYGINVGPLITKTSGVISISRIVRLGLLWFELLEMFLIMLTTFVALWLFGSRHEGNASALNAIMYNTLLIIWIVLFLAELFKKRWDNVDIFSEKESRISDGKQVSFTHDDLGMERSSGLRRSNVSKIFTDLGRSSRESTGEKRASLHASLATDGSDDDDSDLEMEGDGFQVPDFAPGLV
mmetsp:Transcript_5671/g.11349  ORF Transcript_5671/g.11349 Transcript_5671/m.11349 type:complete len:1345 (+) Transcript_5671:84-4118(+)